MRTRGFTLIELMTVLSVIGVLTAIAVPNFIAYRRRAQAAEASSLLEFVGHLEAVRRLETGHYVACPPVPAQVPKTRPTRWQSTPEWESMGFLMDGPVRYQLEVELTDGGFVAHARGDLDGDGRPSHFTFDQNRLLTETEPLE